MARTILIAAVLLLISGAALRCESGGSKGGGSGDGTGGGEQRTSQVAGIANIRLLPGSGGVTVRHAPGGGGQVEQRVQRWDGAPPPPGDQLYHRVEGKTLVLDTDCGQNCSVDFDVTLPDQVAITGELGAGSLDVTGMASVRAEVGSGSVDVRQIDGPLDVRTGSGGVRLDDLGGTVAVETSSGGIEGRNLRGGEVTAKTGSGQIELGLLAPGSVQADSGSGGIELVVPQNTYRVEVETGVGESRIDVPQDPSSPRRLRLSTGVGSIEVRAG
ncbi:DUF4097 family beta strand repeat-containing protein [Saccharopolyspora phatthalungensis]|uniref:DUF4097 domain-containing protein n=1 Tax=Saccharopolyspora phatthalungensis TaxID=664693 RepID=A0A840Q392_9PSEU|nr:DUF4097 family beta strand repeat-containing protein [Saccharopolyspora phatthalungensis]MBB5154457.1 hypothetical protein [Saccharopolyspora phatthalungensis]